MTSKPLVSGFQQHAADALAAGLAVDAGEHDEHAGLGRAADQRLGALQDHAVADDARVGAVVGDVGAGVRLGHADRQHAVAADDLGQDALPDRGGRVAGDHAGLHAGLAQHGHRGDVVDLGDLLQDQRGVQDRQAKAAVFLGHRHAQHAEFGELLHVLPGERAVHPACRRWCLNSVCASARTEAIISRCCGLMWKSMRAFLSVVAAHGGPSVLRRGRRASTPRREPDHSGVPAFRRKAAAVDRDAPAKQDADGAVYAQYAANRWRTVQKDIGCPIAAGMRAACVDSGARRLASIEAVEQGLASVGYIPSRQIATAVYLAHHLQKPILVEGPAGVGKTELAKSVAAWLGLHADPHAVLRGAG